MRDGGGTSTVSELLGWWRLVERSRVHVADGRAGRGEARSRDVGMRVRFRLGGVVGLGVVDLGVGSRTVVYGAWRATTDGLFLGAADGYSAEEVAQGRSPQGWLEEAVGFSCDGGDLVLLDRADHMVARFEREGRAERSGQARVTRATVGVPAHLVPLEHHQLMGTWEPVTRPMSGIGGPGHDDGSRFQNVEFGEHGWWTPLPFINIGSGRWVAGVGGALLAVTPGSSRTGRALMGWVEVDPWLLQVVRAGFDGDLLVLLDGENHELLRLRRLRPPDVPRVHDRL